MEPSGAGGLHPSTKVPLAEFPTEEKLSKSIPEVHVGSKLVVTHTALKIEIQSSRLVDHVVHTRDVTKARDDSSHLNVRRQ